MRKFLGLISLMGQVRKENIRHYWSTDPKISTPIFHHTVRMNRFESIWQTWHFSDNSQKTQDSGQLFKIWPVYEYFVQKFRSIYSPEQELSLDEAMIPWWGLLKFRTYNPGKITKYGVLVRMVYEAVAGYNCNIEVYSAEGKKLEDTVLSLLHRNVGLNHHIYEDNVYNNVRLAQTLLDRNVRVCGTNRCMPRDLSAKKFLFWGHKEDCALVMDKMHQKTGRICWKICTYKMSTLVLINFKHTLWIIIDLPSYIDCFQGTVYKDPSHLCN